MVVYNKENIDNRTFLKINIENNQIIFEGCIDFIQKSYFNDIKDILINFLFSNEDLKTIDISKLIFINSSGIKLIVETILLYCESEKNKKIIFKRDINKPLHSSITNSIKKIIEYKKLSDKLILN